ncbi:hypothetical protein HOF65_04375 [bacterium]|nr:hypothetical protein [bacterium]MBT3853200.1 hypothetical protein [bacterium]MBT4633698.1 hypothetical protein [bacterium]MBT5492459.1 hypothetical protein [bacterium]MBT6779394.1 hypothetical protein [bacterium]
MYINILNCLSFNVDRVSKIVLLASIGNLFSNSFSHSGLESIFISYNNIISSIFKSILKSRLLTSQKKSSLF